MFCCVVGPVDSVGLKCVMVWGLLAVLGSCLCVCCWCSIMLCFVVVPVGSVLLFGVLLWGLLAVLCYRVFSCEVLFWWLLSVLCYSVLSLLLV